MAAKNINMSRMDQSPWGFRVHGGMDFGSPLTVQKVNLRSLGEAAGLQAGDVITAVNGQDISLLKHKEAQEAIKNAGNNFVLSVIRSGQTSQAQSSPAQQSQHWAPQVKPIGEMPKAPTMQGQTFTKTSLAANQQEDSHWDVKHNQAPKGFSTTSKNVNGNSSSHQQQQAPSKPSGPQKIGPTLPTKQYNSPKNMYSDAAIQEIMSQQAEVLAGGVKGINFKQYEPPQREVPANSEVMKALLEQEAQIGGVAGMAEFQEDRQYHHQGFKSVNAPVSKPRPEGQQQPNGPPLSTCAQCDRLITGVFCKVQGKPLHAECFKCSACSTSLKNIGYFSVGDKLYCEPHARAVKASQNIGRNVPNQLPTPQQQPAKSLGDNTKNWDEILERDKAGAAQNAEDFTKQFMSQMFGSGAQQHQQQTHETTQQHMTQQQMSRTQHSTVQQRQTYNQQGQEQTVNSNQGTNMNIRGRNNDILDTSSPRQKKVVGGSRQWPPPKSEDEGLVPTYIDPSMSQQPQKPVSILKNAQQQPSAEPLNNQQPAESFQAGPGQNVTVPRRGKGELKQQQPGMRVPICGACDGQIRGPFITALGRTWCPTHFTCSQATCQRSLQDVGFVEEQGHLYCEDCYGKYLAPDCEKCRKKILGNCLKAMSKTFHPECFVCAYCGKIFANSPFYLEDGLPYCEEDWNELFTTKCVSCGFPIEAGDRWVEALNNNYHSQCFNCTLCKKNLEGKGFFVKAGKPFCKSHARMGM